jgi:hypothetical protein
MKNLSRPFGNLFFLLLLFFLQTSCQKDSGNNKAVESSADPAIGVVSGRVNSWLDKQKTSATAEGISKIQLLKANLEFSTSITEPLFRDQGLIIVPVKEGYITSSNKERNPVNMLVLFLNNSKEIQKGFIVQYIAAKQFINKKELATFMYRYYKFDDTKFTGSLAYLTVADEFSHELNYENGVYRYYKSAGKKQTGGLTETCYEFGFYYYWSDGSVTWEPLGSFCDNCEPVKTINGRTYKTNCGGGGGGGGPEEPALTREMWWEAYREVATGQEPNIQAGVQFWGRKVTGEPQGGHFTQSNDHGYHTFNFTMYGMGFAYAYTQSWHGTQNAYQAIQGTVIYNDPTAPTRHVDKTKTFIFSEVFP